jgi:hypothetical protein
MSIDHDRTRATTGSTTHGSSSKPAAGKSSRTSALAVQLRAEPGGNELGWALTSAAASPPPSGDPDDVYGLHLQTARAGVAGEGGRIPHHDAIQASFGPTHDVGAIRAHVGGRAGDASRALGATAYATGNDVAFAAAPDLHTAAHEAAHVVQQSHGVQLAGGMGQRDDAYEREADAVADAVVAGRSAAPLLAHHAPSNAPSTAIQKKADDGGTRDGEIVLQRILTAGSIDDVTKTIHALKKARARRSTDDPDPTTKRVELPTEPDVVDLVVDGAPAAYLVAPRSTDAMIRVLTTRLQELLGMQPDPVWVAFAGDFNREFATILNAFDLVDEAKDGKRNDVAAIRLQYLFTDEQRALLTGFFGDGVIPDGLFNGDHIGRTTAQQRILMASHILAKGTYRPGSFDQQVHALACFHWARIVHHYAGATSRGLNKGLSGNFDHAGNVVLATGTTSEPMSAAKDASLEVPEGSAQDQKHGDKAWRFGIASWETVLSLEPGDWVYIYNANPSISGAHSLIFGGWEGEEGVDEKGRHYREARVFDQGRPKDGGHSHTKLLGSDIFMLGKRAVNPVSRIARMNADAAPADTVDALTPEFTAKVSKQNQEFVKRLGWKRGMSKLTFDVGAMNAWLQARSKKHIEALADAGRLADGQRALLEEANASDDNHTLVCLYQRVAQLDVNSRALARNEDKIYGALNDKYDDADAARQAQTDAVVAQVDALQTEIDAVEIALVPLRDALDAVDQSPELAEARRLRRRLYKERKALPKTDRAARAAKKAEEDEAAARVAALEDYQHDHKKDIKQMSRTVKDLERDERRLSTKIDQAWAKLAKDDPTAELFGLVHGGSRQTTLDGPINGAYADMPGNVEWETFMKSPAP